MADHPVTLVVDWDDTLVGFRRFGTQGELLPGAEDALRELLGRRYAVTVASCRVTWGAGLDEITQTLADAGFEPGLVFSEHDIVSVPAHEGGHPLLTPARRELFGPPMVPSPASGELGVWVGIGKPIGTLYVDDRGAQFDSDWSATLEEIYERTPRP